MAPFVLGSRCASVTFVDDSDGQFYDGELIVAGGGHERIVTVNAPVAAATARFEQSSEHGAEQVGLPATVGVRGQRAQAVEMLSE